MTQTIPRAALLSFLANVISPDKPDALFTTQREAYGELMRRRKDVNLKKRVVEHLDASAQTVLEKFNAPRAVLFRQVATPTHEILRFLRMAKHMKLAPLILEYYGDKFVSAGNSYKRSLGKMPIYQHTGTDGRDNVRYRTILDFNAYTGKALEKVRCKNGESLIDFHHKILSKLARFNTETQCVDATSWFRGIGGHAEEYYEQFLMLFIRDGILFENYHSTGVERPLVQKTVLPAFRAVSDLYGMRPLIVHLVPPQKELRPFWDSYPKKLERFLM